MRKRLPILLGIVLLVLAVVAFFYYQNMSGTGTPAPDGLSTAPQTMVSPTETVVASPAPDAVASPGADLSASPTPVSATGGQPDLAVDANGLSRATVVMTTNQGVIKFKFYPNDAPGTVKRIIELIQSGFYNGLSFHRVVPNFVIQGGDPVGNGTGGSGQKLKAEFNNRRHVEGAVAMARAADPDSADSQFYIALATLPHLDHNYTVFGQVIEGLDVVRKIKRGDRITTVVIQ